MTYFKAAQLKEQQKFVSDVQGEIEGMNSINGVKLTSKDKKALSDTAEDSSQKPKIRIQTHSGVGVE